MTKKQSFIYAALGIWIFGSPALAQEASPSPTSAGTESPVVSEETGELAPVNDIVVSARRRDEALQDVPQTVNVVTAAQIDKLNLRNFQDIQSVVPGLTLTQPSAFSSQATVRGISFSPEASGLNPSVEFYFNDAPISSNFIFQSTFDFGQFEVQRGPQGTLRGRASPSGAIAVTARRPDLSEVGVVMNGTITSTHSRKLDGAFNIPIISDVLALRVAGVIDNTQGARVHSIKEESNPDTNEGPYRRTKGIRASLRFEPVDWLDANLLYQDLHIDGHSFAQVVSDSLIDPAAPARTSRLITPFDRLSLDDQGTYDRTDQKVFIANVGASFAGQRLSYVGSYNKQDFASLSPQDAGDFFSAPLFAITNRTFGTPAGFEPVCENEARNTGLLATTGSIYQCTHSRISRYTHELRLSSDERVAGIFDYVIGGFYDRNNTPSNLVQEVPLVPAARGTYNITRTAIVRRGRSTEKSIFGNLTAHLFDDRLELSGGLRYIDYKNSSSLLQGASAATLVVLGRPDRDRDNATIYTGSIKYKVSDDVMIYALTGSSYRPGPRVPGDFSVGPTGVEGPGPGELRFLNLPAEKSESYEIGTKTSFLGGRGRFNLSAFHQKLRNYPFRGPSVFYINFARAGAAITPAVSSFNFVAPVPVEVNGVELEASYQILERWSLAVNASYADGKIKNGTIACTDLDRNGIPDTNAITPTLAQLQAAVGAGNTISQCAGLNRRSTTSPKFSANVQSEFGFDLTSRTDGFIRGLLTISGKTNQEPENRFDSVGAYGLLNLYTGIRDDEGAWEISLFAKNILREREILNVGGTQLATNFRSNLGQAQAPFVSQYRSVSVTAPREFGVSGRFALGSR